MNFGQLIIIFIFLTPCSIYSQSIDVPIEYIKNKIHNENTSSEVIQGSKYFDEKFQNGKIIFKNKEINVLLRYNVLDDEFELKNKTDESVSSIVRSNEIKFVTGSAKFAMYKYLNKEDIIAEGYFEILNDGPIQLLKNYFITYNEAEPASNSYSQAKLPRYILSTEYYLFTDNNPAEHVVLRKKDILDLLNTEVAKLFVKENKLNLKTEEEVNQLLNYINKTK